MRTLAEFIAEHGVTMQPTPATANPHMSDMPAGSSHYVCILTRADCDKFFGENHMHVPFSMGPAHTEPPSAADVLNCLASDAAGYENADGFEDWASEYGYDTDSRKAEKIYHAVRDQTEALRRWCGDELFDQLVWHTERA